MSSLEDRLNKERSRRKKEISELYILVQSTQEESARKHLLRALLLLIYAHWEGFIKSSTVKYLKALQKMGIPCNDLHPSLRAFYLYAQFKTQQGNDWDKFSEAINSSEGLIFTKDISGEVSTKSNLNTEVFKALVSRIGVSDLGIDLKKGLIDDGLLSSRNAIAHGEMREIELSDVINYKNLIVQLLDSYFDQLVDAIDNQKYLKTDAIQS
ncbi:MAE_28990/MAE_18760 family HEPN-like nuclease [Thiomicrorhabdus sp. Kp2]|uniref:MAE_28990/MAE_18760 family HEPN-like nuclease n=1 Tax=Thiomicrorhabdus sp. Kp2 TaxID=1123518 RepID=UPI0004220E1B|nr:MAE_28990/MAE_18760 family HEPN-like nuclease [Thiomicrorhabdus sp. Kp2]